MLQEKERARYARTPRGGQASGRAAGEKAGAFSFELEEGPGGPGEGKAAEGDSERIRISQRDLIYFIGQLSIMFSTGLNLLTALECLAEQAKNPSLKRLVENIRRFISEGNPLWLAMKKHPKVFSPVCVGMVRAGESSGTMNDMLDKLEGFLERQHEIKTRVKSALSYPIFMMGASVCVLVFLLVYVFPKFEVLFKGREDVLPLPTRFFLGLSDLMRVHWYIPLGIALAATAGAWWCLRRPEVRRMLDQRILQVPLLGELIMRLSLSRSFHTLGLMLQGGIPTLEALGMARDVAGNAFFQETWTQVAVEAENGRDITSPLRENPYMPPSEIQMIAMGDRSGRLSQVLSKLSVRYEKEIDLSVKNLIRFVEPALVILMGFLVGTIVLSLVLPIFALSKAPM